MSFRVAGARGCAPCQKWARREGFVASKNDGRRGTFEEDLQRCIFRGAVQETCSSEMLGGPGADFLRGVAFWSIRSSGLLRWFCVTGAALRMTWYHFFVAVRSWCVLNILTSKCASRHNGVQFFISHLPSWLRTRRFSEPTFRPSGATNLWKNTVFREFPTFWRTWIFFLLRLFLSSSLLFSDSSYLCFSSVHIVGNFDF